jgi:hypothetical protein
MSCKALIPFIGVRVEGVTNFIERAGNNKQRDIKNAEK